MTLQQIGDTFIPDETPPQQPYPIVRVCWDELFTFLRTWFNKAKAYREKMIVLLGRYSGAATSYQELAKWTVSPECIKGKLGHISLACSDYDAASWWIKIGAVELLDKQIVTALSFVFGDQDLLPNDQVIVYGKTDGTATKFNAAIVGKELYE